MKFGLFTVSDNYVQELPRLPGQLLEEVIEQTLLADELGYDSTWFAEHHFHEYGVMASPQVLLASVARQTKRIRLGASVVVLPFHDPIRVAEDYALVDHLSGGRLNLGLGSGYLPHEFAGFNVDAQSKPFVFNERFEIIQRLWRGEEFEFQGQYHNYGKIKLELLPMQQPIPTWVAALRPEAAEYVAKMGQPIMGVAYVSSASIGELKGILDQYKVTSEAAGFLPDRMEFPVAMHCYVAETREEALAVGGEALDRYLRTRLYGRGARFEDLQAREQVIIGTPEDCVARIKQYQAAGVNHLMCMMNYGGLPHEQVKKSMELFAKEVIPAFERSLM